jgi:L-alanine-DL-glutamate epimerase-like enolase superfamily enzyme
MKSIFSRRGFFFGAAAFPFLSAWRLHSEQTVHRQTIKDLQCMILSGERTYTLVKITASDGTYGIGEAYGSPSIGTKQQILELKPLLVGKNPVGIDAIYSELGRGANSSAGTRTDGSAHNLARAASGVEMALWDLAGHAPKNFIDKESCREWAQKVKSDPRA